MYNDFSKTVFFVFISCINEIMYHDAICLSSPTYLKCGEASLVNAQIHPSIRNVLYIPFHIRLDWDIPNSARDERDIYVKPRMMVVAFNILSTLSSSLAATPSSHSPFIPWPEIYLG